ncbi:redoxin domain-containing protein [Paucibacter sp. Y2R2-4]|uniref:redoxin domain-containing protein n=1 Tax=Paucibacter sp. Y2R2-4 TaxID=2893553 RepID=UPI0021E37731|nr:redoxin domain-containing protein [Paucibacter sp. Y2R2-4]MCV2348296.1 redoxin domain-containing protein [Paucibacter sp. Y2R2-4]
MNRIKSSPLTVAAGRRQFARAAGGLGLALGLLGTPLLSQAQSGSNAATVDQAAPAFTATTAEGRSLSLSSLRGKTVVLEWTNHECPYVKKHYGSGNLQALQKDATGQGVVWLQVISSAPGKQGFVDGPTALKVNTERGAAPTATLLDPTGQLGKLYGAQTSPHLYIINPDGQLVYKGGIDSIASNKVEDVAKADNYVRLALKDLAAGKKPTQATTKPYGCSIKYADA